MQGKCRIYTAYTMVTLIGVLLFVMFIFFIEIKTSKNAINTTQTIKQDINKPNTISSNDDTNSTFSEINETNEPINLINNIGDIRMKEESNIYRVNADILNIRNKPNVESKIIKKYINGDNIAITNIIGEWGELKSGGFAYMEFLEKNDDPDAHLASDEGIIVYTIKTQTLNIREEPNIESNILRKMSINQKIYIERIEGQWGVVLGGGFAYMELLKKDI